MAVGYHFTVKLSTVFKSYFTATWVACATRVKRLRRSLARHWLEAGRKLPHVRMSWNATVVRRARPRAIPLAMTIKKTNMPLSMSMGLHYCGLRPQRSSAITKFTRYKRKFRFVFSLIKFSIVVLLYANAYRVIQFVSLKDVKWFSCAIQGKDKLPVTNVL